MKKILSILTIALFSSTSFSSSSTFIPVNCMDYAYEMAGLEVQHYGGDALDVFLATIYYEDLCVEFGGPDNIGEAVFL